MKSLLAVSAVLILAGCDFEVYRYPCQDPSNWGNEECQKPLCEVSRTCPEHIFKEESILKEIPTNPVAPGSLAPRVTPSKGGCK